MRPEMVSLSFDLPGLRIVRNIGVARGIVVRSRSIVGNVAGAVQTLFGGHISIYNHPCGTDPTQAYKMMCDHAEANGANAVVMMRYDATEIMSGVTEVICYGSAVVVEPAPR